MVIELKNKNAERASEIIDGWDEVLIISGGSEAEWCFYDFITEIKSEVNEYVTTYTLSSSENSCDDYRIHYLSEIRSIIDISPYEEWATCTYNHQDLTIKWGNWKKYNTEFTNIHWKSIDETLLIPEQTISPSPIMTFDYSKCVDNTSENN